MESQSAFAVVFHHIVPNCWNNFGSLALLTQRTRMNWPRDREASRTICGAFGAARFVENRAHICAGTHDHTKPDFPLLRPPITIGPEAWVCADALVGPGVTIGEGAILGARAVAMKDVNPWTIIVGNPARESERREITQ